MLETATNRKEAIDHSIENIVANTQHRTAVEAVLKSFGAAIEADPNSVSSLLAPLHSHLSLFAIVTVKYVSHVAPHLILMNDSSSEAELMIEYLSHQYANYLSTLLLQHIMAITSLYLFH